MNIISIIFALLCLYSRVSSHDQEENPLLSNEQFMVEYNSASIYFVETFNNKGAIFSSWITSQALKATEDGGTLKYDGDWILEEATKDALPNDLGLTFNEKAKHRAISSKLLKDFVFEEKPFILQYEVLHQDGQECGGAYIKLLSMQRNEKPLSDFNDKTPYTIMFGPDKCGALNRLHFIFRHQNPLNGSFEEKHCRTPKSKIDETFTDAKPHLFQLIIRPDNTYEVAVDHKVISYGSLLKDFTPPVNPPSEIDDPSDQKPSNWDDREKIYDPSAEKPKDWNEDAPYQIPDPNAVKPNDWLDDEPVNIRDPSAEKPDDWDNEMDGDWEAPLVPNPACEEVSGCGPWSSPLINNPEYKGKWVPPLINNPDFKGVWTPRKIPNPDYFVDNNPFRMSPIEAVGFELWSMSAKIMFDNIIITDDEIIANRFAALTFDRKINFIAASADSLLNQFIGFTNHYPWLWALYVVILLIPVTLVVVCCFWTTKDTEAEHKKDDNKSKETDSFSNKSLPIDREIITDDKLIEKEEKSSEDNEYEKIKNDTSEEPPHSNGNDDEDDETSGNMEISNGVTENEPEIILKQRKPHSNIH